MFVEEEYFQIVHFIVYVYMASNKEVELSAIKYS